MTAEAAAMAKPRSDAVAGAGAPDALLSIAVTALEDAKAEDLVTIDLAGKSSLADHMIVASGRSDRHVKSIADQVLRALKEAGEGRASVEGLETADWVLIDAGDVVIHVFRPEVRDFYGLEKMWAADITPDTAHA
ncbi:MAG: ribosome silencing factor [Pseudomonadota bacterium]